MNHPNHVYRLPESVSVVLRGDSFNDITSLKLFSDKAYECVSDSIIMFVFCRLSDVVEKEDVTEAIRLVEMSKQSLTHVEENVQRYGFLTIIHFIMK